MLNIIVEQKSSTLFIFKQPCVCTKLFLKALEGSLYIKNKRNMLCSNDIRISQNPDHFSKEYSRSNSPSFCYVFPDLVGWLSLLSNQAMFAMYYYKCSAIFWWNSSQGTALPWSIVIPLYHRLIFMPCPTLFLNFIGKSIIFWKKIIS